MSQAALTVEVVPKPVVERAAAPTRSFMGHAKLIGGLTLVSRVLGLGREVVAGHYLGTGLVASAFTVAFTVPNLFRKLFGEGALSAAFIPLYAQSLKKDGADEANAFAAAGVNMLCAILLALTVIGEVGLGAALLLGGGAMRPATLLTLKLTMIMLPYVLLICGTAFLGGVLQVHKRFGPPAIAPVILIVIHIAVVLFGAAVLGLSARGVALRETVRDALTLGIDSSLTAARDVPLQTTLAYWLSFFVLVAGALQVVALMPALRAVGFRFRVMSGFWTPAVRRMLKLTVPVALGAGVLQLSVLLDKGISVMLMRGEDAAGNAITHFSLLGHAFRYPLEMGAPARLNLAQFLYQFPLGIFAIALATAIFPSLSAEAVESDRERFKSVLRRGIEATLFEGLPATLGLILVREPAVRFLFQHGKITAADAELISRSVLFYSMAIWAFSLQQILNRAYYALHDTVTPLVMSGVTLAVNLAVEIPLLWTPLGEAGMAAGTCVSFVVQALVMLVMLDRRVGGLGLGQVRVPVAKMLGATALMGAACWGFQQTPAYPGGKGLVAWGAQMTLTMVVGALVYFGACAVMGLDVVRRLVPKRKERPLRPSTTAD
jgi:putative peptidoglycan lipid II flippase